MTQQGKCDICRQRKVKCDEQRPTCGQCRKTKRPCEYGYSTISRFSKVRTDETDTDCLGLAYQNAQGQPLGSKDLENQRPSTFTVRSVKEAKEGQGVFHTFNTVPKSGRRVRTRSSKNKEGSRLRIAEVPRPLLSRAVYLCAQFSDLLGENGANWNSNFLWGCWITMVPERIGRSVALDDAADCFISGNIAYCSKKGNGGDATTSKKYTAALRSLQKALNSDDETRHSTETLAAVNLLLLYEEVLAFRELRWKSHYRGLVQLMLARGPQEKPDNMTRSLFYATLNHDFTDAIMGGNQSHFDSEDWLQSLPPENPCDKCHDFTVASREIARHMIQLPRLIALVRQARESPSEVDAGLEALALAEHLYCRYSDIVAPRVDAAFSLRRVKWVDTLDEDLARYCPKSLDFEWFNTFEGLVRYFYVRVTLLEMCATLKAMLPFSPILDAANIEEEEEHCATLIAASVQYAEKQGLFPGAALVMPLPLQCAYGVWWKRQRFEDVLENQIWEHERAAFLEEWCLEKTNAFMEVLSGDSISKSTLQATYTTVAGGGPWEDCKQKGPLV